MSRSALAHGSNILRTSSRSSSELVSIQYVQLSLQSQSANIGVKTIRGAQKHSAANLINLSTVATLFSGVTATMIQFSYTDTATATANAVNGFWFTSLVFSISAAVNSLLGLTWMQAAL